MNGWLCKCPFWRPFLLIVGSACPAVGNKIPFKDGPSGNKLKCRCPERNNALFNAHSSSYHHARSLLCRRPRFGGWPRWGYVCKCACSCRGQRPDHRQAVITVPMTVKSCHSTPVCRRVKVAAGQADGIQPRTIEVLQACQMFSPRYAHSPAYRVMASPNVF